ncbi:hypothetical protein [Myceligenerans halotolerans]
MARRIVVDIAPGLLVEHLTTIVSETGVVRIRPRVLDDGVRLAGHLGLTGSLLHLHVIPPEQELTGLVDGVEVHVHATACSVGVDTR